MNNTIGNLITVAACVLGLLLFGAGIQTLHSQTARPPFQNYFSIPSTSLTGTTAVDVCNLTGGPPCGRTIYVCELDVATKGTATSVSVYDKQTTPAPFMDVVNINSHQTFTNVFSGSGDQACRVFPGGMTVTAANAAALWVSASGKY